MKMMAEHEFGMAMHVWADIENKAMIKDIIYNRDDHEGYEVSAEAVDVLEVLQAIGGTATIKEIAKARGKRKDTTARALRNLVRQGLVELAGKRGHEKLWKDISWTPE